MGALRIESPNSADASFYIDDIDFQPISEAVEPDLTLTPIKDVYEGDFLIGNAISAEDLDGVRLEMLKLHFNVVTAGNAMKPDALVQKSIDNGFLVHGHTLAWHQQSPAWMNQTTNDSGETVPLDRETALTNLITHADTVVRHFTEKFGENIISWDVVNEAMNDNPPNPGDWQASLRRSPWFNAIGPDYLEEAFLAARAANPDVKLYYNDYNLDNQAKAEAV
ncbi:MAG: endo-1,4-beta-xylanase [Clostridiales bacterium]|nr:endo-1,4-beta-xylanase [Clostridiales bacterium]